ncbi:hypothetical protein [Streptomyces sp. AP-93]|uniref:hypothetical protein n=1 Tax=Streptomyces sp. AP-93 TaxID=2929048 RepID=UPI001FB00628|nr:hypothetical protein [Streptomyces sp. AP-93]MCJ0868672.1 hypothetical protein [Streptomyces sp. AP-93]
MAAPALLSTVLLLSGCSGSPSASPSVSPSTSAPQSGRSKGAVDPKQADFFQCLKEKGLPMKETDSGIPVVDSSKADLTKVKEAEAACESRRSVPPATPEELAAAKTFTACMRANGVANFPDPDPKTAQHDMEELGLKESPEGGNALKKCGGRPQSVTSGQGATG